MTIYIDIWKQDQNNTVSIEAAVKITETELEEMILEKYKREHELLIDESRYTYTAQIDKVVN